MPRRVRLGAQRRACGSASEVERGTPSTQCASGFVCDGPTSKCVPAAPASAGDGGCAVAAPQTKAGLAWIFVGGGGLGLVARRRRRR